MGKIKIEKPITKTTRLNLENPAFLVGNGIYYYDGVATLPWSKLAFLILPKEIQNKIKTNSRPKDKEVIKELLQSQRLQPQDDSVLQRALKGISYTEALDFAVLYETCKNKDNNPDDIYDSLKKLSIDEFREMEDIKDGFKQHENLLEIANNNQIPILTTNLERNLIRSRVFNKNNYEHAIATPIAYTGQYLDRDFMLNGYFTTEENRGHINENNISSTFAIWHIHGLISDGKTENDQETYQHTLCLRDEDYNKRITKLNELLENRILNAPVRTNTWLDIFMNNDLIILGLSLDSSEKDIRWLLIQRYFYQKELLKLLKKVPEQENIFKKIQTIYIYRKEAEESEMPCGKRAFFESLGIECIPMETEKIYKFDWISNN